LSISRLSAALLSWKRPRKPLQLDGSQSPSEPLGEETNNLRDFGPHRHINEILLLDVIQFRFVVRNRRFGTTHRCHQEASFDCLTVEDEQTGCKKTSGINYKSKLLNIGEEQRSQETFGLVGVW